MSQPEIICYVEALYAFHSTESKNLSFEKGDQIAVFTKLESGWWNGCCNGQRGWFPSNYVDAIPDEPIKKKTPPLSKPPSYRASSVYSSASSEISRYPQSTFSETWTLQKMEDENLNELPNLEQLKVIKKRESFIDQLDVDSDGDPETSNEELLKNWVERKTPQGRSYFCNLITQETTWDYDEIDRETGLLKKSKSDENNDDNKKAETESINETQNDEITWSKLSSDIAVAIHQLILSSQNRDQSDFYPKTSVVIKSIRVMLYASQALEKDAPLLQNSELREHRKLMISALSKLVISSKMSTEVPYNPQDPVPAIFQKFQRDANEVLVAVRGFVNTCRQYQVKVHHVDPKILDDLSQLPFDLPKTSSHILSKLNPPLLDQDGFTITKTKFLLNRDLITTFQACANQIYGSIDDLSAATSRATSQQTEERDLFVTMFKTLSSQISKLLCLLDEITFENLNQTSLVHLNTFQSNRQSLYESTGHLFSAVQSLTNTELNLSQTARMVEDASNKIVNALENIDQVILVMVNERKRTMNFNKEGYPSGGISRFPPNETPMEEEELMLDQIEPTSYSSYSRLRQESILPDLSDSPTQENSELNDIEFSNDNTVRAGTLVALVERLTAHDIFDTNFITTFLLTYRSFCTTEEFISLLQQRYDILPPENLTPDELENWTERKQKLIRLRVFNVLKNWLKNYYIDEDQYLLPQIEHFTNTNIRDTSSFAANQLLKIIEKRNELCSQVDMKMIVPKTVVGPLPILPKNLNKIRLVDTDPIEMARQLCIIDFKLYSSIRPIECLGKAWSKDDADNSIALNIKSSIHYCNRLTTWVTSSILQSEEIRRRVTIIRFWIQVADQCRTINNFNTAMAILSAFDNSAIGRLKKTWTLVNRTFIQSLSKLRKLLGADKNFSKYREIIHSVNPPCIPFLGIYLQDLTFIEDGNPDYIYANKLINFSKRQKTSEVIRELKQFQSTAYPYYPVTEFQDYIQSKLDEEYDIEKLYERSLKLEPRNTESTLVSNN